jgi:SNF2 family DNA or RNA helicase
MLSKQIRRETVVPGELMYRLRALSDGYLVKDVETDKHISCSGCAGAGWVQDIGDRSRCRICEGSGQLPQVERQYVPVNSPKLQAFVDILDNYMEHGRLIAWAPLHGTMDLLRETAQRHGWDVLQFDGRKCALHSDRVVAGTQEEMLQHFQTGDTTIPCVFIGNPEAAGMGLTLTAADAMVFYSNSWKPEARQQGEDRIHRPGSRGCKIYDIVCMPIDDLIREALLKKERLQDLSLGKLHAKLDELEVTWDGNKAYTEKF